LAGFAVTLVVLIIGFWMSVPLTAEQVAALDATYPDMTTSLGTPFIFTILEQVFQGRIPEGGTLYLHPIAFAGWVGCLVTALNLFPASQLDGGHALRGLVDSDKHRIIGFFAMAVMFLLGFYLMAILVLVLSQGGGHPGPLNDTLPVSASRKAVFVLAMIILVITIPPLSLF
jgi:membrane-associated protease RseP (regulator of RpoE activity)